MTWHDFIPPTHFYELDYMVSDDTIHSLTHVIFVLITVLVYDEAKSRYCETLL
jgi:hypothetical protein